MIAQKMAETFEGTLEDATLKGLQLLHGMGMPAYTKLQALAKQRETSVPKALRAAVDALGEAVLKGKPGVIGRPKVNEARDQAIFTQVTNGHTYAEVASAFQVSLVRVGQIVAQQRAMRGIKPQVEMVKRNEEILRRVGAGESRLEVAAALNVSRSVVDYLISQANASQPRPTRVLPKSAQPTPTTPDQPEDQKDLSLNLSEESRPRYVMPSLAARQAQQAEPVDTRTAVERDVVDPEFGF
jgi:transposase